MAESDKITDNSCKTGQKEEHHYFKSNVPPLYEHSRRKISFFMSNLTTVLKHLVLASKPVLEQPCFQREAARRNGPSAPLVIPSIGKAKSLHEMVRLRCRSKPGDQCITKVATRPGN